MIITSAGLMTAQEGIDEELKRFVDNLGRDSQGNFLVGGRWVTPEEVNRIVTERRNYLEDKLHGRWMFRV